jgi:hypothetical protein
VTLSTSALEARKSIVAIGASVQLTMSVPKRIRSRPPGLFGYRSLTAGVNNESVAFADAPVGAGLLGALAADPRRHVHELSVGTGDFTCA